MKKIFLRLIIFLSAMLFGFENASACSCSSVSPCEAFSSVDTVFVGTVISSTDKTVMTKWQEDEKALPYKYQFSRLKVEESFGEMSGKEVFVVTDLSTSCLWRLKKGAKYLIYGEKTSENTYSTGYCSRSALAEDAKEDLNYLRSIPKTSQGSVVSGLIAYSQTGGWYNYFKKERVDFTNSYSDLLGFGVTSVLLESETDKFQTKINIDGKYLFPEVPKGKYKLKPILPDILTIIGTKEYAELDVAGHGCNLRDFLVVDNGQISGKITDADGKPIFGITVSLIPKDIEVSGKYVQSDRVYDLSGKTDENGIYRFKGLLEGEYFVATRRAEYISANSIDAAYPSTFYPKTPEFREAVAVRIEPGKTAQNINFGLLAKFKEKKVSGRVFLKNKRPAARVFVRYVARTPDRKKNSIVFIKTDENGFFSFTGYEDHYYLVGAFTDERNGNDPAYAVEQEIFVKDDVKKLAFVLDRSDDECGQCGDYMKFPEQK